MKRSVTLPILILLVAATLISVVGAAHPAEFDLCDPSAENFSCALPPSVLLRAILGEDATISTAELAYLDGCEELYLFYSDAVTHRHVSAARVGADTLQITASPYAYTAKNGVLVTWIPVCADLQGEQYSLTKEGDAYTATLPASDDGPLTVTVSYTVSLTVSATLSESIANRAFRDGLAAYTAESAYKKELEEHEKREAAYQAYLAQNELYAAKKKAYDDYQSALLLYERRLLAYENYLTACEEFAEMQTVYEAYLTEKEAYEEARAAYAEALADVLLNEEAYRAYLAYTEELRLCRDKLAIMDHILHKDHRFYPSLVGGAVTTVLERRGELVALGCSAEVLESTAAATERLRAVLPLYLACTDEAERYRFYTEHYADISRDIHLLSVSLYTLFANPHVQLAIDSQGKLERYMQFTAQLYVADMLLSDTTTFSDDWSITSTLAYKPMTKTLSEAIGTLMAIPEDHNRADPRDVPYPERVGEELPSDLPTAPTPPLAIRRPIEPEYVGEPTRPSEVSHPGDPPTPVPEPEDPPTSPVTDENLLSLSHAVGSLTLKEREGIEETEITLLRAVDVAIGGTEGRHTVLLYDDDQRTLLASFAAEDGASIDFTPPRKQDAAYNFDFSCFRNEVGEEVSLASIKEPLTLYAEYTRSPRTYTVTWLIGEMTETTEHLYGEIPVPPDQPKYEILSFDKELRPVSGNATYTASCRIRRYEIAFRTPQETLTVTCRYGEIPTVPAPYDRYWYGSEGLRPFSSVSPAILPVSGPATYTLSYGTAYPATCAEDGTWSISVGEETDELAFLLTFAKGMGADLRLLHGKTVLYLPSGTHTPLLAAGAASLTARWEGDALSLCIADAQGTPLSAYPTGVTLYLPYDGDEDMAEYADISLYTDGETTRLFTSYRGGALSCRLPKGGTFSISEHFPILLPADRGGTVSAETVTENGVTRVILSVYPTLGYRLRALRVTDSRGTEIPLSTDNSFLMPRSPVTVAAEFEERLYTVRFFVDGNLISSRTYRYGEELSLPPTPTRAEENGVRYTFRSWSPIPLRTVVADADYHATFGEIYPGISEILSGGAAVPPIYYMIGGGVLALTAAILIPCLLHRKKKRSQ